MNIQLYVSANELPLFKDFDEIAKKEGKSRKQLVKELVEKHVRSSKEGTGSFKLEKWAQEADFIALPSIGEVLHRNKLDCMKLENLNLLQNKIIARYQEVTGAIERRNRGEVPEGGIANDAR